MKTIERLEALLSKGTEGPWKHRKAGSAVEGEPGHEKKFEYPDHIVHVSIDDLGRKVTAFVAHHADSADGLLAGEPVGVHHVGGELGRRSHAAAVRAADDVAVVAEPDLASQGGGDVWRV